LLYSLGQGLIQIGCQVGRVFETERQAHHVVRHAGGGPLLAGELGVGGAGRVDDERFGVADVGEEREELQGVDEFPPRLKAALDAEGEDGPRPFWQVLCCFRFL